MTVDLRLDAAVRYLRAHLPKDSDCSLSIFVDPTLGDAVGAAPVIQQALRSGLLRRIDIPIQHSDIAPESRPYLLHAESEQEAEKAIELTLRYGLEEAFATPSPLSSPRHVCAWIVGERQPHALAARLAKAGLFRNPEGVSRPFRYWDPRVMWHLPRAMEPSMWTTLRANLGCWLALDMCNELRQISDVLHQISRSNTLSSEAPVKYTVTQWAALARIRSINLALSQAREWNVSPTQETAAQIDCLIRACHSFGFETEQDAQVFVACGLTSHPRFFDHEGVKSALNQAHANSQSVLSALGKFDDSFWDELRSANSNLEKNNR